MKSSAEPLVWIRGEMVPHRETRLSPLDLGFAVGDGVFETLMAYKGKPFSLMRHWNRLVKSCQKIYVQFPDYNAFRNMIEQTILANHLEETDARVRVTVTSGEGQLGAPRGSTEPTVLCTAAPVAARPAAERVAIVPWTRNENSPLTGIKSMSYGENVIALNHARSLGAGEPIFGNTRGHLCEGATTNLFLVHRGRLHTPPLSAGCLPGITREHVLDLCHQHHLPIHEDDLPLEALREADEAFLTSSTREVHPISHVDGKPLSRCPGPQSLQLAELFRKLISAHSDP
jgi:branched-chain amino acid aminotransferase